MRSFFSEWSQIDYTLVLKDLFPFFACTVAVLSVALFWHFFSKTQAARRIMPYVNRFCLCLLLVGIGFAGGLIYSGTERWEHYWRAEGPGKQELLELYYALEPGQAEEALLAEWKALSPKHLRLERNNEQYIAHTPRQFFYKNWILIIPLESGVIDSICVRVPDSYAMKPGGSPPDKTDGCPGEGTRRITPGH